MDVREALNAISDVIVNRPSPIREFDQIYMKAADMVMQAGHVAQWLHDRRCVFVGDGDAMSVCILHLHNKRLLEHGPREVLVLDFDERVLNAINRFAKRYDLTDRIATRLYNVADPVPTDLWQACQAFYSNPPFGASNGGKSVQAFLKRGFELTGEDCIGCVVIADAGNLEWTQRVLQSTQRLALDSGFVIAEMIPAMHTYHLDDTPELTSCSVVLHRLDFQSQQYSSLPLSQEDRSNFYGMDNPLTIRYVKDSTRGGSLPSRDYKMEPFAEED